MRTALKYNYNFMLSSNINGGVSDKDLMDFHEKIKEVSKLKRDFTFTNIIQSSDKNLSTIVNGIRDNFQNFVIVGIGGSDLGSRCIVEALQNLTDKKVKIFFIGNNTDPDEINSVLSNIDLDKTLFNVISKSGETVEILANFLYIRDILIQKYNEKYTHHLMAITNKETGTLLEICKKEKIPILSGTKDIGDRFSVLSIIGMLTAAVYGLDVEQFLEGARYIDRETQSLNTNEPLSFALLSYILHSKYGKSMSVLMPYSSHLKQFGYWYRQLWAESLGKKMSLDGKEVFAGITPIASVGSTDQHSQIQLYNEGPNDKIITFIEIEKYDHDITLSTKGLDIPSIQKLDSKKMSDINHIEREATALSLKENGRPNGTISMDTLDEYSLGALFYFFELAVGYLGALMNIDTFNQPGVEKGKQHINEFLEKN